MKRKADTARRIIFICTGNTCRSPMAEGLLREMLKKNGTDGIVCSSAGINAFAGDEAQPNAIAAAAELGADISEHRSRPYHPDMAGETDLFVCMTPLHAMMLADVPGEKKVILAGGIPDPYGGELEEYRVCAQKIASGLEELLEELKKRKIIE